MKNGTLFPRLGKDILLASTLSLGLLSCGAELVTAGISGTGIVVGVITGFGSIYVNGVEYDIEQASFDIDGQTEFATAAEAQQLLAVGMVVRLEATDNGDGTGVAARVVYDDTVEGPIETVPQQVNGDPNLLGFSVLGRQVIVDAVNTSFDGVGFDQLSQSTVVEISGFLNGNGVIIATRIEGKGMVNPGQTRVELHGIVSSLTSEGFMLDGATVAVNDATRFDDMQQADLVSGLSVEVEGVYQAGGGILATRIESEEDDEQEVTNTDREVELQGIVSNFVSSGNFRIGGIQVDASGLDSALTEALADGVLVEIKGQMVQRTGSPVLVAESIEYRGAEAEMKARLSNVDTTGSTLTVDWGDGSTALPLIVGPSTLIKDDREGAGQSLNLSQLAAMLNSDPSEVELSLRQQGDDWNLVVLKLKDDLDEYEAEGILEAVDESGRTVTLFGIQLPLDDSVNPASLQTINGERVEVKDTDQDGDIDEVEVDD